MSVCWGSVCVCVGREGGERGRDRGERSNQKVEMSVWLVDSARDYLFKCSEVWTVPWTSAFPAKCLPILILSTLVYQAKLNSRI